MPEELLKKIKEYVKELGYWPSVSAFVREACMAMLEKYKPEYEERKRKKKLISNTSDGNT